MIALKDRSGGPRRGRGPDDRPGRGHRDERPVPGGPRERRSGPPGQRRDEDRRGAPARTGRPPREPTASRPGGGDGGRSGGPPRGGGRRPEPAPVIPARPGHELLYGRNGVWEALRGRRRARRLWLAEGVREDDRLRAIVAAAESRGAAIERIPRPMFDDAFPGANHQGVALEAEAYPCVELGEIAERPGTVLVLDHLQDPQNFGTLLRAAEAAGVAGVVIAENRAVGVTPAVVNASAGAVEHLLVAAVPNLPRALDQLKTSGRWAIGLAGEEGVADLFATDVPTPAALVVGAEGGGLGQRVRATCDLLVSLPMRGKVASLNAATAGAIALYELERRVTSHESRVTSDE